MPDNTVTLAFNDDVYTDKRGEKGTYTGSISVDYTTGTYSGRVNTEGAGFSASVGLSGHIGANNGNYSINQGNFIVGWTGQQPTTASVEFVLNNNQDFRTSLNPPGQRNQPVVSSDAAAAGGSGAAGGSTSASSSGGQGLALRPLASGLVDTLDAAASPGDTFVFDPGHGHDVVRQFTASGVAHDTLSLSMADFNDSVAQVLHATRDVAGSALITDPVTRDTVRLVGVSKADLAHNWGDIAFHG